MTHQEIGQFWLAFIHFYIVLCKINFLHIFSGTGVKLLPSSFNVSWKDTVHIIFFFFLLKIHMWVAHHYSDKNPEVDPNDYNVIRVKQWFPTFISWWTPQTCHLDSKYLYMLIISKLKMMKDCCVFMFSETWLNRNMPDISKAFTAVLPSSLPFCASTPHPPHPPIVWENVISTHLLKWQ